MKNWLKKLVKKVSNLCEVCHDEEARLAHEYRRRQWTMVERMQMTRQEVAQERVRREICAVVENMRHPRRAEWAMVLA